MNRNMNRNIAGTRTRTGIELYKEQEYSRTGTRTGIIQELNRNMNRNRTRTGIGTGIGI